MGELLAREDFGERAAELFESAVEKGAAGLKLWKDLGLTARLPSGRLLRIDDERLNPIFAKAEELGVPICMHTCDPPAFHQPLDRHNERYLNLMTYPSWRFHGPRFPPRDEILEQRNRVIARFPNVTH